MYIIRIYYINHSIFKYKVTYALSFYPLFCFSLKMSSAFQQPTVHSSVFFSCWFIRLQSPLHRIKFHATALRLKWFVVYARRWEVVSLGFLRRRRQTARSCRRPPAPSIHNLHLILLLSFVPTPYAMIVKL